MSVKELKRLSDRFWGTEQKYKGYIEVDVDIFMRECVKTLKEHDVRIKKLEEVN